MANILRGVVITPQGPVGAKLGFERRIEAIVPADVSGPFIVPGFIDTHVHGGDGSDTMDGHQGVRDAGPVPPSARHHHPLPHYHHQPVGNRHPRS